MLTDGGEGVARWWPRRRQRAADTTYRPQASWVSAHRGTAFAEALEEILLSVAPVASSTASVLAGQAETTSARVAGAVAASASKRPAEVRITVMYVDGTSVTVLSRRRWYGTRVTATFEGTDRRLAYGTSEVVRKEVFSWRARQRWALVVGRRPYDEPPTRLGRLLRNPIVVVVIAALLAWLLRTGR